MALKNVEVKKNGVDVGTAEAINLIEGTNVTITATNDYTANDELDVTISAAGGGGGSGHTIKEDGAALTARAGLNFTTGLDAVDDVTNDETDVSVDTSELSVGGELGGTVAAATVNATHSGSTHAGVVSTHEAAADPHAGYRLESADHSHASTGLQAGTVSHGVLTSVTADQHHAQAHSGADHTDPAAPITQAFGDVAAAGTGTLPPANEDHKHGMPADPVTAHAAAGDPHTGYRLESADHTHATTGLQAGTIDHGVITGLLDDDHTQYRLESVDHTHQSTGAQAGTLDHGLALTGLTDDDHTQYRLESQDIQSITFSKAGALTTGTGTMRWYNDTGRTLTFASVRASVGTAPTGASIIVDVNVAGTTIYTTQGSRPEIAVSTNTDEGAAPDVTTLADGNYLTVDVDQVGSTEAGADLSVSVWYTS